MRSTLLLVLIMRKCMHVHPMLSPLWIFTQVHVISNIKMNVLSHNLILLFFLGAPYTSSDEDLKSKMVALLGILANPRMKTIRAMEVVGPQAFGLKYPYSPPRSVLGGTCDS